MARKVLASRKNIGEVAEVSGAAKNSVWTGKNSAPPPVGAVARAFIVQNVDSGTSTRLVELGQVRICWPGVW